MSIRRPALTLARNASSSQPRPPRSSRQRAAVDDTQVNERSIIYGIRKLGVRYGLSHEKFPRNRDALPPFKIQSEGDPGAGSELVSVLATQTEIVLQQVMRSFPRTEFAVAHGSGVYRQMDGQNSSAPLPHLDLVFAVDDAEDWHDTNLFRNPHHYSFLKHWDANTIAYVQKVSDLGAKIYYNTRVPFDVDGYSITVNYGVISVKDLTADLEGWETLFVAGRLHKPVVVLENNCDEIAQAMNKNLRSALSCALVQETCQQLRDHPWRGATDPPVISIPKARLFERICGLSYIGDVSKSNSERQHKVKQIVESNLDLFSDLYAPHIEALSMMHQNEKLVWSPTRKTMTKLLDLLPYRLQHSTAGCFLDDCRKRRVGPLSVKDVMHEVLDSNQIGESLDKGLQEIVSTTSKGQILKQLLTAGPIKSFLSLAED
eukprot:gb/GEZN01007610.1/.p1 GENE.gb/GEZN01007610.1/~~gb/GEZN01007610.1/.p1  ORF type:complete len:441 (-),score=42.02 gb/GEZN01007610.1/:198-1490(-)